MPACVLIKGLERVQAASKNQQAEETVERRQLEQLCLMRTLILIKSFFCYLLIEKSR